MLYEEIIVYRLQGENFVDVKRMVNLLLSFKDSKDAWQNKDDSKHYVNISTVCRQPMSNESVIERGF